MRPLEKLKNGENALDQNILNKSAAIRPLEKIEKWEKCARSKKMKNAQQCAHWKKKKSKNPKCAAVRPLEKIEKWEKCARLQNLKNAQQCAHWKKLKNGENVLDQLKMKHP